MKRTFKPGIPWSVVEARALRNLSLVNLHDRISTDAFADGKDSRRWFKGTRQQAYFLGLGPKPDEGTAGEVIWIRRA